ncbi:glutathione s-transferase [Trebouxia sp. C0009 RCD-2024]
MISTSVAQHTTPVHLRACKGCIAFRPVIRPSPRSRCAQVGGSRFVQASATAEDVQKVQESSNDGKKMHLRTAELLSWDEIGERAGSDVLQGYQVLDNSGRDGQPRTAPTRVLPTEESTTTDKPVLLYRDTNAWCPFCERVWLALEEKNIPYDTVLINLQDKPEWFTKMIPTQLVPAAKINGKLVYESYDIMMELEKQFPETPLLPSSPEHRAEVEEVCQRASDVSSAGYKYLASRMKKNEDKDPEAGQQAHDSFLSQLDMLEGLLGKHAGPYLVGDFGMADIVHCSAMERFAANMPVLAGMHLRSHSRYPNISRWYSAMDARPAYQKVKSDDTTLNLVIRKVFGMAMAYSPPVDDFTQQGRDEAAAKLSKNKEVVRADIVKRSGILRGHDSSTGASNGSDQATSVPRALQDAVDYAMRRLASYLLTGEPGPKNPDAEARAVEAASLAYFRNRASAPRDLSANACQQLRDACLAVLQDAY